MPRAQYLLCRVLYRRGALGEARSRLEQLLEQHPDALQFHQLMSWTLARLNEPVQAEMHRQRTQRLIFLYLPDVTREEDDSVRGETGDELVLRTALDLEKRGQGAEGLANLQAHLRQSWTERMAVAAAHIAYGGSRGMSADRFLHPRATGPRTGLSSTTSRIRPEAPRPRSSHTPSEKAAMVPMAVHSTGTTASHQRMRPVVHSRSPTVKMVVGQGSPKVGMAG